MCTVHHFTLRDEVLRLTECVIHTLCSAINERVAPGALCRTDSIQHTCITCAAGQFIYVHLLSNLTEIAAKIRPVKKRMRHKCIGSEPIPCNFKVRRLCFAFYPQLNAALDQ